MGSSSTPHERHGMTHEPSRALPWKSNGLRQSCVCSPDVKLKVPPACQSESQSQLEVSQVGTYSTSLADASRRCSCMKRSHPIASRPARPARSPHTFTHTRSSHWSRPGLAAGRRGTRVSIIPSSLPSLPSLSSEQAYWEDVRLVLAYVQ